jgi:outer membrane protein OmpA-like peptidoglycan-associated protein
VVAINGLDSVNATRIGSVNATGSGPIQPTPQKIDPGPVDETVTYTLTATNGCGGSETRTASLHITGSIEGPSPAVAALETSLSMNSVYFPTALPAKRDPAGGLLQSQKLILRQLAEEFRKYLSFRTDARLILQAHADNRGSVAYNQTLSERRAERVRDFLVEQGVPPANLETVAYGKERNLDPAEVKSLEEENPSLSPVEKKKIFRNLRPHVLANNRRVDIVLSTTGQASYKFFPYLAADAKEILGSKAGAARPSRKSQNKR